MSQVVWWVPRRYRNNSLLPSEGESYLYGHGKHSSCFQNQIFFLKSCICFASGHSSDIHIFQSKHHYPEKKNYDCFCFSETIKIHKNLVYVKLSAFSIRELFQSIKVAQAYFSETLTLQKAIIRIPYSPLEGFSMCQTHFL